MPTFRDINQFNAVADTEVNPDWTLQVSATQRITLRQIAQLVAKPKSLTIKVGESTQSYDTTDEVEVDIKPTTIGAAPVKHSHTYNDVTGNSLNLFFDTGGGKRLGIENYAGGTYNKQISTPELLSASTAKNENFLEDISSFNLGLSNLLLTLEIITAEINMTNQEFHMRIPFQIHLDPDSGTNTLPQGLYVGGVECLIPDYILESLDFSELLTVPGGLEENYQSAICMKHPFGTSSVILRTGGITPKLFLFHVQASLVNADNPDPELYGIGSLFLVLSYYLDLYQDATYVDDAMNGGVIDIRVPIADLVPWSNTTEAIEEGE